MSLKCSVLKSGYCEMTQGFGGTNNHRGLDLVGKGYTIDDIVSYDNGNVLMSVTGYGNGEGEGVNWRYGNFVKIQHDDGTVCLYAHMEYTSVKVGQRVSKGQVIGKMGNSGNSFGGHLHWEFWSKNDYNSNIDPNPYLQHKEPIILPKAVERNKNKRQFQVDYNDNLRVRKIASLNGEILGILNAGIYDFSESKTAEGYLWVKVKENMWCACTNMSRILEVEKEHTNMDDNVENMQDEHTNMDDNVENQIPDNEEKVIEEENINISTENKNDNKDDLKSKESVIVWILNIISKIIEKLKRKG